MYVFAYVYLCVCVCLCNCALCNVLQNLGFLKILKYLDWPEAISLRYIRTFVKDVAWEARQLIVVEVKSVHPSKGWGDETYC